MLTIVKFICNIFKHVIILKILMKKTSYKLQLQWFFPILEVSGFTRSIQVILDCKQKKKKMLRFLRKNPFS